MKVAVIGAGGVGCFYGTRLLGAGHDVRFLMRSDLETVRARGLTVHSPDGDFHGPVAAYGDPAEIGAADLVICSLKATALNVACGLVAPCVGPNTRVLVMMNGLGVEEPFAEAFGARRVLGGMAFVCINRIEPGVVRHIAYGQLLFGHCLDDKAMTEEVADLFRAAGVDVVTPGSLKRARWQKLVWNIPFSTLAISAGGVTTQHILEDDGLRNLARELMVETIAAANGHACAIEAEPLIEKMFTTTATMGPYRPSMLVDYEEKRPLEVEAILGEPVRRARQVGVAIPRLEMNYHLVRMLDRINRGELEDTARNGP